jgi:hypothetical protein
MDQNISTPVRRVLILWKKAKPVKAFFKNDFLNINAVRGQGQVAPGSVQCGKLVRKTMVSAFGDLLGLGYAGSG